ncbi:MAG TPA: hypothetical protein VLO11_00495 [Luteolibacter sp.]|nr:hypothetical protein [Luteolibacter sp.]
MDDAHALIRNKTYALIDSATIRDLAPSGVPARLKICPHTSVHSPLCLIATLVFPPPDGLGVDGCRTAGAAMLMAVFWITEPIPIPATAMDLASKLVWHPDFSLGWPSYLQMQ